MQEDRYSLSLDIEGLFDLESFIMLLLISFADEWKIPCDVVNRLHRIRMTFEKLFFDSLCQFIPQPSVERQLAKVTDSLRCKLEVILEKYLLYNEHIPVDYKLLIYQYTHPIPPIQESTQIAGLLPPGMD